MLSEARLWSLNSLGAGEFNVSKSMSYKLIKNKIGMDSVLRHISKSRCAHVVVVAVALHSILSASRCTRIGFGSVSMFIHLFGSRFPVVPTLRRRINESTRTSTATEEKCTRYSWPTHKEAISRPRAAECDKLAFTLRCWWKVEILWADEWIKIAPSCEYKLQFSMAIFFIGQSQGERLKPDA